MYRLNNDRRRLIARSVAVGVDAVQLGLFPLFGEGIISPANAIMDCAAFGFFSWLLGWHIAFLPTFLIEQCPVVDLAPTWTVAVFIVTRSSNPADEPISISSETINSSLEKQSSGGTGTTA